MQDHKRASASLQAADKKDSRNGASIAPFRPEFSPNRGKTPRADKKCRPLSKKVQKPC
jgi:hypothetical protein